MTCEKCGGAGDHRLTKEEKEKLQKAEYLICLDCTAGLKKQFPGAYVEQGDFVGCRMAIGEALINSQGYTGNYLPHKGTLIFIPDQEEVK